MDEETRKLLEQVAAKLGTTSEYLWSTLLTQARIEAITLTIFCILALVVIITAIFLIKKYNEDLDWTSDSPRTVITVISVFAVFFSTLFILFNISNIIAGFFNPDFWALNYILEQLNGGNEWKIK